MTTCRFLSEHLPLTAADPRASVPRIPTGGRILDGRWERPRLLLSTLNQLNISRRSIKYLAVDQLRCNSRALARRIGKKGSFLLSRRVIVVASPFKAKPSHGVFLPITARLIKSATLRCISEFRQQTSRVNVVLCCGNFSRSCNRVVSNIALSNITRIVLKVRQKNTRIFVASRATASRIARM